jgi:secondary thiamine-phosphate synthase enzyme
MERSWQQDFFIFHIYYAGDMIEQVEIQLPSYKRGFHIITDIIMSNILKLPENGLLHLFIKHTSASLTINENADPTVSTDLERTFNKLIPEGSKDYSHSTEGPDDMPAHIKSSMIGCSVIIPITNHRFNLGTWQGIFLCEFRDHGGRRKLVATIYS